MSHIVPVHCLRRPRLAPVVGRLRAAALALALFALPLAGHADEPPTAAEIVERANNASYYAGNDGRTEARMLIVDGRGREQTRQFTILRRDVEAGVSSTTWWSSAGPQSTATWSSWWKSTRGR